MQKYTEIISDASLSVIWCLPSTNDLITYQSAAKMFAKLLTSNGMFWIIRIYILYMAKRQNSSIKIGVRIKELNEEIYSLEAIMEQEKKNGKYDR